MIHEEYVANPVVVARACQLWVRMLSNPKYDNGETDMFRRFLGNWFAEKLNQNNTSEVLEKFERALFAILMTKHKYDFDTKEFTWTDDGYYCRSLCVDYAPDHVLDAAAEYAG